MERFFISGCQRSGTTMLRLILESHPCIQCFDEGIGYSILVRESKGEASEFVAKEKASLVGFKIPRFAEQLTWSEFSDPDYGVFSSFYKDQKVIHIFRGVLDVVASMIRLKTPGGASWLDKYGRNILQAQIANHNISDIYRRKYMALERQGLPDHMVGALYWEIKNQGFFDLLEQNKPVYAIGYETLVSSPKKELHKLGKFLEVSWNDSMLNHHEHPHGELDENGVAIGFTDSRRPIDTQSIDGYRNFLTEDQIHDVSYYVEDSVNNIKRVLAQ